MKFTNTRTGQSIEIPCFVIRMSLWLWMALPLMILVVMLDMLHWSILLIPPIYQILCSASLWLGLRYIGLSNEEVAEFLREWMK